MVSNLLTFKENKALTFQFYNERRLQLATVKPNAAHLAIANLQRELGAEVVKVVTQNVDDLFERAVCTEVVHVHGELIKIRCLCCEHVWNIGHSKFDVGDRCPECGQTDTKPFVIFFHERVPRCAEMLDIFMWKKTKADVVVVIGTHGAVIPMSCIVGDQVQENYAFNILCNLDRSGILDPTGFQLIFFDKITDVIESIIQICKDKISEVS